MKKQYYTPEIEDFFDGYKFEYKEYNEDTDEYSNTWTQSSFDARSGLGHDLACQIGDENIRVPYLDQEDIESIGWKFEGVGSFKTQKYSAKNNKIIGADFNTWYSLHADFGYKDPQISIYIEFRGGFIYTESTTCIFKGECKSINEFKILMKMLMIK